MSNHVNPTHPIYPHPIFPFNRLLPDNAALRIVHFICSHDRQLAMDRCDSFCMSPSQMAAFIERNAHMLPPKEAA